MCFRLSIRWIATWLAKSMFTGRPKTELTLLNLKIMLLRFLRFWVERHMLHCYMEPHNNAHAMQRNPVKCPLIKCLSSSNSLAGELQHGLPILRIHSSQAFGARPSSHLLAPPSLGDKHHRWLYPPSVGQAVALDPCSERGDTRVDTGVLRLGAPDPPRDDADLVGDAVLHVNQRPSRVALGRQTMSW